MFLFSLTDDLLSRFRLMTSFLDSDCRCAFSFFNSDWWGVLQIWTDDVFFFYSDWRLVFQIRTDDVSDWRRFGLTTFRTDDVSDWKRFGLTKFQTKHVHPHVAPGNRASARILKLLIIFERVSVQNGLKWSTMG